ncbi:MAG TPA: HAMP domain-containing sensor histidine kinase [Opitutales bacterium]|nr:HAMP domain-containing sensor histidine kinase [Opitutales bacterium]
MQASLGDWFYPGPFMPHGGCYLWTKGLVALHVGSDALIVLAYYSIPFTLIYFVRKRTDLQFNWMFVCFAMFILACGTTHLMEIWNVWHGAYWTSGIIKAITALASVPTAYLLIRLVPAALMLPSPSQLRSANAALETEIAARKRSEELLQQRNAELAQANESKDRFLASMSHELRTPLNAILGFTGTLMMRLPGPINAKQEQQLQIVDTSAKHLLSLINDLLDLARIEAGKTTPDLEEVNANVSAEDVVTSLLHVAAKKGLRLALHTPKHDVLLRSDRRALHQILLNLVSNAIKFTPKGSVSITVEERVENNRALAAIAVQDTGPGIAPADLEKLFEPFRRLPAERSGQIEGTGLGLHLSRKLAELLGGRISVQSEPGQGSCFTLLLPKE